MKDVKMDDMRFVLDRFFYGWKMNAMVFDFDGKLVDFVMGTKDKVNFSKKEEIEKFWGISIIGKPLHPQNADFSRKEAVPWPFPRALWTS